MDLSFLPAVNASLNAVSASLLLRGRVKGSGPLGAADLDLGKPATLGATSWLKVNPVDNRVEVALDYPDKALPGQTIDITISSLGNAQSLRGGSLLMAPLRGADGDAGFMAVQRGNLRL